MSYIKKYLSEIGRRGGRKSRRILKPDEARGMVKVREARRAVRRFRASCFWSFDPDRPVTAADVPWVAEQLRKNGGRDAWEAAEHLCR